VNGLIGGKAIDDASAPRIFYCVGWMEERRAPKIILLFDDLISNFNHVLLTPSRFKEIHETRL
jgi:hypothetical protein